MKFRLLCLASTFLLAGCASSLMSPIDAPLTVSEEHATVTFFRTSSMGSAIQAPVAKQNGDHEIDPVGIISKSFKVTKEVAPGDCTFVVGGEAASVVKGSLLANKHYYVRVEPRMGFWKARFVLNPMTAKALSSEDLQNDIKACTAVRLNAEGEAWFDEKRRSMTVKLIQGLADYEEREVKGKPARYIKPEDGVDWILY